MDELCKICERVKFGEVIRLGFEHWRHADCAIGSDAWKLYYQRLSLADRRKLSSLFNNYYGSKT